MKVPHGTLIDVLNRESQSFRLFLWEFASYQETL